MATHSSVLAWRIPGTGESGGLPSMGSHRVGHGCSDLAADSTQYIHVCVDWYVHTWTWPDGQFQNQTDYILCSRRWRSCKGSSKTRQGADCGSDHELLIAKFRLKLKKRGKTTRPFRYDLNQIPYDSTVDVRNRFKGLDLIESLKNYGWRFVTLYRRQKSRPSPRKINAKRQISCLRRPYK